jgi:putative flavoprotein involved in K+ transport
MFTAFDGDHLIWPDGTREQADTVIFAIGYRPNLDYLQPLGALDKGTDLHEHPTVAVIGAGPVGLAAAACERQSVGLKLNVSAH